ncbi:MAG TPA: phosphatidate cytidylyltransferase [Accumulibacter sp.]|nr:phosphatidate cytidylyltransferase [Accumulibacter sp.]HMW17405.1 phosphatidate cytidylyltransferase [Accumulibacter sp.]HMX23431.1 phosphatidate cytidylyltransferase [Accumulibacter sp.]HNC17824.1 phosphatidate cytidylyltransferase [Accumulibacter sp.]HND80131.1 phosphatidate cytidylyltransferase [Accumulibacter sp.]
MSAELLRLMPATGWWLTLGIATVLCVASLIGWGLRRRLAGQPNPTIDNLNQRIQAWWLIAGGVGVAFLGGKSGITLLFALASLAAWREYLSSAAMAMGAESTPSPTASRWPILGTLLVGTQYGLVWYDAQTLFSLLIPTSALTAALVLRLWRQRSPECLAESRRVLGASLVTVYGVSHVPALLNLSTATDPQRGAYLLLFLLLVVQLGDVLQYLWGKLAGRRPIAPTISPGKTVEGTIGGIASAGLLGGVLSGLTPFGPLTATLLALLLSLLGFVGGLLMSAEKRRRGLKDWGKLLPGHGGMLDRIDSLFLSAPFFCLLLRDGGID